MKVLQASSQHADPSLAVAQATGDWPEAPQMIIAFSSSKLAPADVSRALSARFPGSPIVGCTTAGEQLGAEHRTGSLAVVGIWNSSIRWQAKLIRGLAEFREAEAAIAVDELLGALGQDRETLEPDRLFALLLIDGLSMMEERITVTLAEALEGVPLVGGSAGDDLCFKHTHVYNEDGAFEDAAILVLGSKGNAKVEVFKHQHYLTTPAALCITKADPSRRVVQEIDGYPAIQAYAAALGMTPDEVTSDVTFLNPITFSVNGEIFVRSIQSIQDDGSMVLYCGIEEGMVLEVGCQASMVDEFRKTMETFDSKFGRADLMIGFNCILRALEAGSSGVLDELGAIMAGHSGSLVGFDTYGEQLNGMHINQTLVALAFSEQE